MSAAAATARLAWLPWTLLAGAAAAVLVLATCSTAVPPGAIAVDAQAGPAGSLGPTRVWHLPAAAPALLPEVWTLEIAELPVATGDGWRFVAALSLRAHSGDVGQRLRSGIDRAGGAQALRAHLGAAAGAAAAQLQLTPALALDIPASSTATAAAPAVTSALAPAAAPARPAAATALLAAAWWDRAARSLPWRDVGLVLDAVELRRLTPLPETSTALRQAAGARAAATAAAITQAWRHERAATRWQRLVDATAQRAAAGQAAAATVARARLRAAQALAPLHQRDPALAAEIAAAEAMAALLRAGGGGRRAPGAAGPTPAWPTGMASPPWPEG